MNYFSRVLEILEGAVGGKNIKAHRNFWRGKSVDEFVEAKVFGFKLVEIGNSSASNLVRALRGEVPFGSDVDPKIPGETIRRMPAALPQVSEADMKFIEDWINLGCPEASPDVVASSFGAKSSAGFQFALQMTAEEINRFFREFDDYFMFAASDQVGADIGAFFGGLSSWPGLGGDQPSWDTFLATPGVADSISRLSEAQIRIFTRHFGDPIEEGRVVEAFVRFGSSSLPDDQLRPQDPRHHMDGHTMWNIWLAFASASIQLGIDVERWGIIAKGVVVGLVHDSLYRSDRPMNAKLFIKRYVAGQPNLEDTIVSDFTAPQVSHLLPFLVSISIESLTAPPELVS